MGVLFFFYFSVLLKIRLVILSLHVLIYSLFIAYKTILESSWTSLRFLEPSRWAIKAQNTFSESADPWKDVQHRKKTSRNCWKSCCRDLKNMYTAVYMFYTSVIRWYTGRNVHRSPNPKSGSMAVKIRCLKLIFNPRKSKISLIYILYTVIYRNAILWICVKKCELQVNVEERLF